MYKDLYVYKIKYDRKKPLLLDNPLPIFFQRFEKPVTDVKDLYISNIKYDRMKHLLLDRP